MRFGKLIAALLLCSFGLPLRGGPFVERAEYNTRLWQMEDGLPHNIVQAIAQAEDGYLWVGTREGLARFDGATFQKLDLISNHPPVSVSSLFKGRDGVMWVGTDRSGLFRVTDGAIERCQLPDGPPDFEVREITGGPDGAIWFVSAGAVYRWKAGRIELQTRLRRSLVGLSVDPQGGVWTVDDTLRRVDVSPGTNDVPSLAPIVARGVFCDADGTFWIGAERSLIKVSNGVVTSFPKGDGPSGHLSKIIRDASGVIWVGSYSGLSRFQNGEFIGQGEPYRIYALFEDREKNLWVGSEEGLSRLTPKVFKTVTKKDGLSLNTVVSVCASRDGSVWISAWGGGLNHWVDGKIAVLGKTNGLSSDFIMALTEGADGSLWAGADYRGDLNRIRNGQITTYGRKQGFDSGAASATTVLYEDERGMLWIGSRELLQTWDGTKFSRLAMDDAAPGKLAINAICGGKGGEIWIGTDLGLRRWQAGTFENLALKNPQLSALILSLYQDPEGSLWIGTKGKGLLRLKDDVVQEFTSAQGLFSDAIYSILEDNRGNLWLNSSRGIFRLEKQRLDIVARVQNATVVSFSYGKADGILSSGQYQDVTQPAACKSTDGRLWFRTTQGVAVVDPKDITTNENPPPVVIQGITADKRSVGIKPLGLAVENKIVVKPGRGELEIQYNALSFRAPEKNQFRYLLEGLDQNWVEAGNRRVAPYSNLRPGNYVFHVTACNNDGVWSRQDASVALVLEPHVWQTWWFATLCVLVAVGLVGSAARYVTRQRMERKLERLQQQHVIEKERTRIARDMHDELGAKLTRISFQGDTARRCAVNPPETDRHISRISETARELLQSLDQIVWAVDPENDSLESLANYICRYASDFASDSPIDCKFRIPRRLPDCRLSTDVRHNVFLAVKEALNNAVKHSDATQIVLAISVRDQEFEIGVSDNGKGIAAGPSRENGKPRRAGRGLGNLRERMVSIHGSFELESEPSGGTTVRLIVPLPRESDRLPYVYPSRTS